MRIIIISEQDYMVVKMALRNEQQAMPDDKFDPLCATVLRRINNAKSVTQKQKSIIKQVIKNA